LFVPELPGAGGELELPDESARHARVLRLESGARVGLFDGRSGEADAVLTTVSRDAIRCRVEPRRLLPAAAPALHIVLGLPKAKKLEDITRMLTELGVSSLHVALCERSVPLPSDSSARMLRLERIALEACAQSGQPRAPDLHPPRPLLEIARAAPHDSRRLVLWERAITPLDAIDLAQQAGEAAPDLWAIIGPEGGLSETEVETLAALGFTVAGLGSAILRVETATPVISALLLARLGRLR
jgi:16S rRNA (uracil1498-N3)-methyltransferase